MAPLLLSKNCWFSTAAVLRLCVHAVVETHRSIQNPIQLPRPTLALLFLWLSYMSRCLLCTSAEPRHPLKLTTVGQDGALVLAGGDFKVKFSLQSVPKLRRSGLSEDGSTG